MSTVPATLKNNCVSFFNIYSGKNVLPVFLAEAFALSLDYGLS